jgi:hypothetical protein
MNLKIPIGVTYTAALHDDQILVIRHCDVSELNAKQLLEEGSPRVKVRRDPGAAEFYPRGALGKSHEDQDLIRHPLVQTALGVDLPKELRHKFSNDLFPRRFLVGDFGCSDQALGCGDCGHAYEHCIITCVGVLGLLDFNIQAWQSPAENLGELIREVRRDDGSALFAPSAGDADGDGQTCEFAPIHQLDGS